MNIPINVLIFIGGPNLPPHADTRECDFAMLPHRLAVNVLALFLEHILHVRARNARDRPNPVPVAQAADPPGAEAVAEDDDPPGAEAEDEDLQGADTSLGFLWV